MSAPHPRIVYALPPKRRRVAKARPSRQEVPAIVGPEPQRLEPDAETLARADKADALFRELVRQRAWDVLPRATRKTLLDHAHDLIGLTHRADDRRGRYRGKPRRIMLCHPDMDLDALGTPPHEAEPRVVA
jgi:hypothetical protein